MTLTEAITQTWESTNEAGGALAAALHALRTDAVDTPQHLRVPAKKVTAKDQLGEALLLVAEARQAIATAALRISNVEAAIQKDLATR